ncbi:MAG: LysR family transcriptional regulator [Herminiimonas sp.]|nr:LysR family transcriptional regulator [Herminiimonas sp.]
MVAQERSFTQAARQLCVSQSALTVAIKDLELDLGTRLFDRTTRSVELTAQGERFFAIALRVLDELARGAADLRAYSQHQRGSVVVGAQASFIDVVLAPAIASLSRLHPGIAVRLVEDKADGLFNRVTTGEVDFAIATRVNSVPGITGELLLTDRLGVLSHPDHPLALSGESPTWSALAGFPRASLTRGAGIVAMLSDPKVAQHIQKAIYEVSSVSSLLALVETGVAIAILPSIAAYPSRGKKLSFRSLRKPYLQREMFFLTRQGRSLSPAAICMRDFMHAHLETLHQDDNLWLAAAPR